MNLYVKYTNRFFIIFVHVAVFVLLLIPAHAAAQDLTLPQYSITIDPAELNALNANPWTTYTKPAVVEYDGEQYACHVRYRGATGRDQPKKSWKILYDDRGPFGESEINLNSEYRDISISRNHISMKVAAFYGLPVPFTRVISLNVNEEYFGVFTELEQVNEDFFSNRDIICHDLFKSLNLGARFGIPLNLEQLPEIYSPKIVSAEAWDILQQRLCLLQYSKPGTIQQELEDNFDIESILMYFAIQYSIVNRDGFVKNFYVWRQENGKTSLIPWDCDASFGNDYCGNYVGSENQLPFTMLAQQAILQHLTAVPEFNALFHEYIADIITNGFDFLEEELYRVYDQIRNDIYQDTCKRSDNEGFEEEKDRIFRFLDLRSQSLTDLDWFHRMEVDHFTYSPDYLTSNTDTVTVHVQVSSPAFRVEVVLIDPDFQTRPFLLFDNGQDGDDFADDLIYSSIIVPDDLRLPISMGIQIRPWETESAITPTPGWSTFDLIKFPLWSLIQDSLKPVQNDLQIGAVSFEQNSSTFFFPVENQSNHALNLSGCQVSIGTGYKRFQWPDSSFIEAGEVMFITNHAELAGAFLGQAKINQGLFFIPSIEDTLLLTTPNGSILTSRVIDSIEPVEERISIVVINEINYNSHNDFNTGDWVELYIRDNTNLNGWKLKDSIDDHVYSFPSEYFQAGSHIIICRNAAAFESLFPNVEDIIGEFNFGLAASGDEVRLYDNHDVLVDWVIYDDDEPWAPEADGDGPTLELINPREPNLRADNWRASDDDHPHGTPGEANSVLGVTPSPDPDIPPQKWELLSLSPNPFNSTVQIEYTASRAGIAHFRIFDTAGRIVNSVDQIVNHPGQWRSSWDGTNKAGISVTSGVYFIQLLDNKYYTQKKVVFLK